jgi:hypothetical protein
MVGHTGGLWAARVEAMAKTITDAVMTIAGQRNRVAVDRSDSPTTPIS